MTKNENKGKKLDKKPNFNNKKWGVSLSVKQCQNFGLDPDETLQWLLDKGFRRFRLMTYWDEIEKSPDKFDFTQVENQIKTIAKYKGQVTLCLGARQPRWPENHWTEWVWQMDKTSRDQCLIIFLEKTVKHLKKYKNIVSYQLENEALLSDFGERVEIDRTRLNKEFRLVKLIDPDKPIIMTTSSAFGIPIIGPIPDIVGFSFYNKFYNHTTKSYETGKQTPLSVKIRSLLIRLVWQKSTFIHELQLEPWGPKNIWEMDTKEQDKSMDYEQIKKNLNMAKSCNQKTIDLWGGEWWCWRAKKYQDQDLINFVLKNLD